MTPEQRVARLRTALEAIETDLIVCPELFLSGYAVPDDGSRYAEPVNGAMAHALADMARENRTAIIYGYPEMASGRLYNAAQCFDAMGCALANHRKLALPPGFETGVFSPGNGLTVFELDGVQLGLLICYEAEFPEAVRATSRAGADIVVVPTALGTAWPVVAHRVMPTRAFENGVYLAYANHAGSEGDATYLGASCIVGPDGTDLARAGSGEEIISATIDVTQVAVSQQRLPYHSDAAALEPRLQIRGVAS